MRGAQTAPALIEEDRPEHGGIEQSAVAAELPAPGPPCTQTTGMPSSVPTGVPVDALAVADVEPAHRFGV